MSSKMVDLIRSVRRCKTSADERAVITKECAKLRTDFKSPSSSNRARNVAKLLYIHMLGYPSHFGQMECLKLIVSPVFADKRIGYLALMLMLDERTEILTLATNSIQGDLKNGNAYIQALALSTLANIGSREMFHELSGQIAEKLRYKSPFIRKKAALVAIRMFRRAPGLVSEFIPRVIALLSDKNHAVVMTGTALALTAIDIKPSCISKFKKHAGTVIKILRRLVTKGWTPDRDVSGMSDPFLQVKAMALLRILGQNSPEISEAMSSVLAQVATSTDINKNAGKAVLYECVKTVMAVDSDNGLVVLAINILGRFLMSRDNNIRYVALHTLCQVALRNPKPVWRHKSMILDSLRDNDVSIRRRAVALVFNLIDKDHVEDLVAELLVYAKTRAEPESLRELGANLTRVAAELAPSRTWHIDTLFKVIETTREYCPTNLPAAFVKLLSAATELHANVAHRAFALLADGRSARGVVEVCIWCVGEYADLLLEDPPKPPKGAESLLQDARRRNQTEIVDALAKRLRRHDSTSSIKSMTLNALLKVSVRFSDGAQRSRVKRLLATFLGSMDVELQQRSLEYTHLVSHKSLSGLTAKLAKRMPVVKDDGDTEDALEPIPVEAPGRDGLESKVDAASELEDLFGPATTISTPAHAPTPAPAPAGDLDDLFGPSPTAPAPVPAPAPAVPVGGGGGDDLEDLFGPSPVASVPAPAPPAPKSFIAYDSPVLSISFAVTKPEGHHSGVTDVLASFTNKTSVPISGFLFQAAVPKYMTREVGTASGSALSPGVAGQVTQRLKLRNSMHGTKPILLRMKIQYTLGSEPRVEQGSVSKFPVS